MYRITMVITATVILSCAQQKQIQYEITLAMYRSKSNNQWSQWHNANRSGEQYKTFIMDVDSLQLILKTNKVIETYNIQDIKRFKDSTYFKATDGMNYLYDFGLSNSDGTNILTVRTDVIEVVMTMRR